MFWISLGISLSSCVVLILRCRFGVSLVILLLGDLLFGLVYMFQSLHELWLLAVRDGGGRWCWHQSQDRLLMATSWLLRDWKCNGSTFFSSGYYLCLRWFAKGAFGWILIFLYWFDFRLYFILSVLALLLDMHGKLATKFSVNRIAGFFDLRFDCLFVLGMLAWWWIIKTQPYYSIWGWVSRFWMCFFISRFGLETRYSKKKNQTTK